MIFPHHRVLQKNPVHRAWKQTRTPANNQENYMSESQNWTVWLLGSSRRQARLPETWTNITTISRALVVFMISSCFMVFWCFFRERPVCCDSWSIKEVTGGRLDTTSFLLFHPRLLNKISDTRLHHWYRDLWFFPIRFVPGFFGAISAIGSLSYLRYDRNHLPWRYRRRPSEIILITYKRVYLSNWFRPRFIKP